MTSSHITHLHAGFCQTDPESEFFAHEDVRVVGFGEAAFQLVKLCRSKPSPVAFLLLRLLRARLGGILLLLLLLLLFLTVHRYTLRIGSSIVDIVSGEKSGPLHGIGAWGKFSGVARVSATAAQPALQCLPVTQKLRRRILHP